MPSSNLHVAEGVTTVAPAARFAEVILGVRTAAVAFSGGVDSSVVLALLGRHLGPGNVTAVLGVSSSLADAERAVAHDVAAGLGVRLMEVHTQEMADERYVVNDAARCYFCKHELYTRSLLEVVADLRVDLFANGDTADDVLSGDRPGRRAALELGVRAPLAEAGIGKAEVREVARQLALPVWDKPSSPCLASRIPRLIPVTTGRLREVERAELALRALGHRVLRVRHGGPVGLVELGPAEQATCSDPARRQEVEDAVRGAGFERVEISPQALVRD